MSSKQQPPPTVNSDNEITHVSPQRGYEYLDVPVLDLSNPTGAGDASATFRVTTKAIPYWANGINSHKQTWQNVICC